MNIDEDQPATDQVLFIPEPLSKLTWALILISLAGILSFPYADFQNRNFVYYLNEVGNKLSYGSLVLLPLFVVFLWRGYRKGLPIPKTVWIQLGLLLFLILSLGVAHFG
jgi:hypothetical protein